MRPGRLLNTFVHAQFFAGPVIVSLHFAGVLLVGLLFAQGAQAHTPSESFSRWRFADPVLSMQFTVTAREVSRIPDSGSMDSAQEKLASYLSSHVAVGDAESDCQASAAPRALTTQPGYVQVEMIWRCANPPATLDIRAFFDLAAEHIHFARLDSPAGLEQKLLTGENTVWKLGPLVSGPTLAKAAGSRFQEYVKLGFRHIAGGLDHVTFLVGLLLLCRRLRDVIWAVTGFTLGHSITLGLAAFGLVQANVPAIEATIGLTIALVAIERTANMQVSSVPLALTCAVLILLLLPMAAVRQANLGTTTLVGLALFSFCYLLGSRELAGRGDFRLVITCLFGLIHGFGFASAFQAASMGQESLVLPLAGFNVGVELGQLVLVSGLVALGWVLRQRDQRLATVASNWMNAIVCGFGVFWFVQRGLGAA